MPPESAGKQFTYRWRMTVYPSIPFVFGFLWCLLQPKCSCLTLAILIMPAVVAVANLLRARARIDGSGIALTGLFGTVIVKWDEVQAVKWPTITGGLLIRALPKDLHTPLPSDASVWQRFRRAAERAFRGKRMLVTPAMSDFPDLVRLTREHVSRTSSGAAPQVPAAPRTASEQPRYRLAEARKSAFEVLPLVAVIALVGAFNAWVRDLESQVQALEESIRQAGSPLNGYDLQRKDIPRDSDNAATVYVAAGRLLKYMDGEPLDSLIGQMNDARFEIPKMHLSWARKAAEENEFAIQLLDEAASRPDSRYDVRYSEGADAQYRHSPPLRQLCRFLIVRNLVELERTDGNPVNGILRAFDVAYSMRNEPSHLGIILRWRFQRDALSALKHTLRRRRLEQHQVLAVSDRLDREMRSLSLVPVLRGERALALQMMDDVVDQVLDDSVLIRCGWRDKSGARPLLPPLHKPVLLKSRLLVMRTYGRVLALVGEVGESRYDQRLQEPFTDVFARSGPLTFPGAMAVSLFGDNIVRHHYSMLAELRAARGALSLEEYRRLEGKLPESVGELVSRLGAGLPEDPFTGGSLMYRRTEVACLVYSVGSNREDDGGLDDGMTDRPDIVFEVPLD